MALFVFLALFCFAPALASFEPRADDCGNECENLVTASECNAIQECVENEWSKPKVMDSRCEKCITNMEFIAKKVKESSGEEEIKNALWEGCEKISHQELQEHCKKFVNSDWNIAVEFIKADVKPDVFCAPFNYCKTA